MANIGGTIIRLLIDTVSNNLPANTVLSNEDLALKLYDGKADYTRKQDVIGKKLLKPVDKNSPLLAEHFQ